jgi:hypothetical protein
VSHNKFGRRLSRHRSKHREYFEGLAAAIVRDGHATVEFGAEQFNVKLERKFSRPRWLTITTVTDRPVRRSVVSEQQDLVRVIADYLMLLAADIPGVVIPPP